MTSAAAAPPSTTPPDWPHCGHGADPAADPVGCRGTLVAEHTTCLAHLDPADRTAYLATLSPGASLDHRGTPFTASLLTGLLEALTDPTSGRPHIGDDAWFEGATFGDSVQFRRVTFGNNAQFDDTTFGNNAWFDNTTFGTDAQFYGATFGNDAWFDDTTFGTGARFNEATFGDNAHFYGATFGDNAWFNGATFVDNSRFSKTKFGTDASFNRAIFGDNPWFNEATFGDSARFDNTTFGTGAWFNEARFGTGAWFNEATFGNDARLDGAEFRDDAWFGNTTFGTNARFSRARFGIGAWFYEATFGDDAQFAGAEFGDDAQFDGATFGDDAEFYGVRFCNGDLFDGVTFKGDASFTRSVFERTAVVGPLVCSGSLDLSGAVFGTAVTIESAAAAVHCRRTRWASTAALRLRHAAVDLTDAVMEYPVSVAAHTLPFTGPQGEAMAEPGLTDPRVQVVSLRGADAAHLVLTDVDLTTCRFAGTIHLDQLRLEGRCPLPTAPSGQRRWGLLRRWTPRHTLAEEQHWRADRPSGTEGWTPAPEGEKVLEPAALAPTYRQLRKAFEDGKNEPGAADFYYGEMEMRRHDEHTPRAERALLAVYWAVSGYGLRASRAIGWLLMALAATVTVMMLWGLPQETPKPTTTGRQAAPGQKVKLVTDTPDPVNPSGSLTGRLTGERFSKALHVTLESGLFRSSGKNLTSIGTGAELTFRFTAPILLALAVLAVRGRVKR